MGSRHSGTGRKGSCSPGLSEALGTAFPYTRLLAAALCQIPVLEGPPLDFDCLVPKHQPPMYFRKFQDEYGNPLHVPVTDSHEWYASALRIGIFQWQVGFSCRSVLCQRNWCKLHRDNPDTINPVDIYSLVDLFEACGLGQAISIVDACILIAVLTCIPSDTGQERVINEIYNCYSPAV